MDVLAAVREAGERQEAAGHAALDRLVAALQDAVACGVTRDEIFGAVYADDERCERLMHGRQCGRRGGEGPFGGGQFLGMRLCGQHEQDMRAQVRAEILRSKVFAKEALAEEDRIADWQLGLPDPNAPAGSVVYFARRHPWCVKIGFSADKNKRMREIADNALVGMSAGPVKLLATIPGARPKEHALHQRFRHLHIGKEWFLLNDELRRFIRGIGEQPVSAP